MKKNIALILAASMMLSLVGCSNSGQAGNSSTASTTASSTEAAKAAEKADTSDDKTYTLKVGVVITADDPLYAGLQQMKEEAEEKSNGRLKIELYHSSQLGDTGELVEQAVAGANVATIAGAPFLEGYCKDFGILMGPYLMENYDECLKLTTSDLYDSWVEEIEQSGVRVLCFNYQQGERYMCTTKKVEHPEDMKGMMIRTFSSDLPLKAIEKTGAVGNTMTWGEVYTGISQKVIDGCEVQLSSFSGSAIAEVAPYVAKTGHFQMLSGLVVGSTWYDSLPDDLKEILNESAYNGGIYASNKVYEDEEECQKKETERGAVFTEVDREEWKACMDPIYDELGYRELKDQVDAILGK